MVETRGAAVALMTILMAVAVVPAPASANHVLANWVYGEPKELLGLVEVTYVEIDQADQGGRVRIFMGDGVVACLNGPVGAAFAPATQTGYITYDWRGCHPFNPLKTFTYRLERGNQGSPLHDVATATFDYDYSLPGVYKVWWRAGNEHGLAEGQSVIVAA